MRRPSAGDPVKLHREFVRNAQEANGERTREATWISMWRVPSADGRGNYEPQPLRYGLSKDELLSVDRASGG